MPTVETNGIETYYTRAGDGPPVVLLHGGGSDHQIWEHQVEALIPEYEVIRYDLRGHGRTGPSNQDRYDIDLFADDLDALLEALDITAPRICGHSFGGMTALNFAARYPASLSALAVAGAPTPETRSLSEWTVRNVIAPVAVRAQRLIGPARVRAIERRLFGALGEDVETVEAEAEALRDEPVQSDPQERVKLVDAVRRYFDGQLDLTAIEVPTLVMHGVDEPFTSDHTTTFQVALADGVVRAIPEAGHNVHLENPEATTEVLQGFLDGVGAGTHSS